MFKLYMVYFNTPIAKRKWVRNHVALKQFLKTYISVFFLLTMLAHPPHIFWIQTFETGDCKSYSHNVTSHVTTLSLYVTLHSAIFTPSVRPAVYSYIRKCSWVDTTLLGSPLKRHVMSTFDMLPKYEQIKCMCSPIFPTAGYEKHDTDSWPNASTKINKSH